MTQQYLHHLVRQWSRSQLRVSLPGYRPSAAQNHRYPSISQWQHINSSSRSSSSSSLPRIAQSSFWDAIFPKSIRDKSRELFRPTANKPANPASYFIWIYILIGSQAVRILGVQNEHRDYMRKADLKIAQLREVVERLQRGEEVDVEKVLGSGDPQQEQEWEDAMREIENEERIWQESKKMRDAERERRASEEKRLEEEKRDASPVSVNVQAQRPVAPGFY